MSCLGRHMHAYPIPMPVSKTKQMAGALLGIKQRTVSHTRVPGVFKKCAVSSLPPNGEYAVGWCKNVIQNA